MHILTLHRRLVQKDEGQYVGEGDTIRPGPNLTATLRAIVQNGFAEFYTGMTATKLRRDIRSVCAGRPHFCRNLTDIITSEDLAQYKAVPRTPFKFSYDASSGYEVYTAPAPYGGPALAVFLGIVTSKYMYMQSILTYLINAISGYRGGPSRLNYLATFHLPLSCIENITYATYNADQLLWVLNVN